MQTKHSVYERFGENWYFSCLFDRNSLMFTDSNNITSKCKLFILSWPCIHEAFSQNMKIPFSGMHEINLWYQNEINDSLLSGQIHLAIIKRLNATLALITLRLSAYIYFVKCIRISINKHIRSINRDFKMKVS